MPDAKPKLLFWLVMLLPFTIGLHSIARPFGVTMPRVVTIVGGALVIVAGLGLLWGARTGGLEQKRSRIAAVAFIIWGTSQLLPWPDIRLTLNITAVVIIWAAVPRRPRRLFLAKAE